MITIKAQYANEITIYFVSEYIVKYDIPDTVQSDNGLQFKCKISSFIAKILRMKQLFHLFKIYKQIEFLEKELDFANCLHIETDFHYLLNKRQKYIDNEIKSTIRKVVHVSKLRKLVDESKFQRSQHHISNENEYKNINEEITQVSGKGSANSNRFIPPHLKHTPNNDRIPKLEKIFKKFSFFSCVCFLYSCFCFVTCLLVLP
ncbi:hypothetical protein RFI_27566 [Reticulomyxa filosa]|uniref:Uncharacterized protein n=1 Tax=Reticulomyxa filosa TaxID=46433 RepID=X6M739_RETFI|nr:hypothetical protein RFI_27566 [Reticulomyxa filosa]|eukprot:ETO09813.1 hypothetical protein RFI_27566 [Reticulomyxa filosa]